MVVLHSIFRYLASRYHPRYNLHEEAGPGLQVLREAVFNPRDYPYSPLVYLYNPLGRLRRCGDRDFLKPTAAT